MCFTGLLVLAFSEIMHVLVFATRGLLIDVGNDTFMDVIKYYFTGADAPLCYALVNVDESCGGRCIHEIIDNWMSRLPEEHETLWMVSVTTRSFVLFLKTVKNLVCKADLQFLESVIFDSHHVLHPIFPPYPFQHPGLC